MESASEKFTIGDVEIDNLELLSTTLEDSYKIGWTDEVLEQLVICVKFPKQSFEQLHIKLIISQFFYLYFTGNIVKPEYLQCIIYSAAALLNVTVKNGYERIFSDQCGTKRDYNNGKCFYAWQKVECDSLDSVDASNNDFLEKIKTALRLWDDPQNSIKEQGKLMRLTGFLALTLLRVVAKNEKQLMMTFKSKEYREILAESVEWKMNEPFSSPCEYCLKQCAKCINHAFNFHVNKFFTIVVRYWVIAQKINADQKTKNLLYLSLLESTEYHGMGITKMFFTVSKYTGRTCKEILEEVFKASPSVQIFSDWKALVKFYKDYILENNLSLSLPWTRLIDTDYFRYSSPKNSIYVAATFSKILENIEGPGVFQTSWIRNMKVLPAFIDMGKELGQIVYERLMNRDLVETEEGV